MTASADVTRLMNDARVHLPGVLDEALQLELFNVLDEFLRTTKAWQEVVEFTGRADATEYDLDLETTAHPFELMFVRVADTTTRVPATMPQPGYVILAAEPTPDEELEAVLALTVKTVDGDNNPQIDAWIIQQYRAVLLEGLLGRMMLQVAKPYSNERMSIYHSRRFRNLMAEARVSVAHQHLYSAQAWRFPQGFASIR